MPGVRLQHYKGGLYRMEGACLIKATLKTRVLYRPEQGNATNVLWMRPAAAFDALVDMDQGPACRFSPVREGLRAWVGSRQPATSVASCTDGRFAGSSFLSLRMEIYPSLLKVRWLRTLS